MCSKLLCIHCRTSRNRPNHERDFFTSCTTWNEKWVQTSAENQKQRTTITHLGLHSKHKWITSSFTHCMNTHLAARTHVTLLPVTETTAKLRITTLRQSMCQHLHTFTQQVSRAASYVFLLVNIWKRAPKRADGQTMGCPDSSICVGPCQTWLHCRATQQVRTPSHHHHSRHHSGLFTSSLILSLGWSLPAWGQREGHCERADVCQGQRPTTYTRLQREREKNLIHCKLYGSTPECESLPPRTPPYEVRWKSALWFFFFA